MKARYLLFCLLWLGFAACQKDEDPALLPGAWQVLSIKPVGEDAQAAPHSYILNISEGGHFHIQLDVNHCGGSYRLPAPGRMEVEGVSCDDACCDSPFALSLTHILAAVERFQARGRKLALRGERGEIALRSRSDDPR